MCSLLPRPNDETKREATSRNCTFLTYRIKFSEVTIFQGIMLGAAEVKSLIIDGREERVGFKRAK